MSEHEPLKWIKKRPRSECWVWFADKEKRMTGLMKVCWMKHRGRQLWFFVYSFRARLITDVYVRCGRVSDLSRELLFSDPIPFPMDEAESIGKVALRSKKRTPRWPKVEEGY